jgi:ABC-type uncharacterized transport system ATPase subunit
MAGIRDRFDPHRIQFEPLDPAANVQCLRSVPGVSDLVKDGAQWEVVLAPQARAGDVIPALVASVVPSRVEVSRPTLEDVFVSIVSGDAARATDDDARLRAAVREGGQEVRR